MWYLSERLFALAFAEEGVTFDLKPQIMKTLQITTRDESAAICSMKIIFEAEFWQILLPKNLHYSSKTGNRFISSSASFRGHSRESHKKGKESLKVVNGNAEGAFALCKKL